MGGTVTQDQATQLPFTVGSETWIIAANVLVYNGSGVAVASLVDQSTLINNGNIYSFPGGLAVGVVFAGTNGSITNNAGAVIKGGEDGLRFSAGLGNKLDNQGTVIGATSAGVLLFSPGVITNSGEIFGANAGIADITPVSGTVINNFGLINSNQHGIQVLSNPTLTTVINNSGGGTIQGAVAAIATLTEGNILLTNRGKVIGGIDFNAPSESDTIFNRGKITGEVHLGPGEDLFNGKGGNAITLFGEDGNDHLIGSSGKDTITGGVGIDTLTGGKGADKFVFTLSIEGGDKITDFKHTEHDRIDLHLMDADPFTGGDQPFHFIGKQHFHNQEGELRFVKQGKALIVSGDINGDGIVDFQIEVHGVSALAKGDFLL